MSKASAYFVVENVDSGHKVKGIKKELDSIAGVTSVSINGAKSRITVDYDTTACDTESISRKLEETGCKVYLDNAENTLI